jgi:acetate kinase
MKVLAINCGSSTLKFQVIETKGEQKLASGIVDKIGDTGKTQFIVQNDERNAGDNTLLNHDAATRRVLYWLKVHGFLEHDGIEAIGHRVVHGGDRFVEPTIITDEVIDAIESLSDLAPLHNIPSLQAIRAARSVLGPRMPMVATFDTAFHRAMPEQASLYAIPPELAQKHKIKRYGFHGLAHRYMVERYSEIASRPIGQVRLITLQLGNGCSATAIQGGRSVDTSMGFTPLEGLMMGTRCGDLDPSLEGFLAHREGIDIDEVENLFNKRSGLLGISGLSHDMRELLKAESLGNAQAALAVEMFCYRIRKYIGSYLAALGGADAIVFGGGIGENSAEIRARICSGLEWCGLVIDAERNSAASGTEMRISTDEAKIHAYVIPVDEALIIARDTARCLSEV